MAARRTRGPRAAAAAVRRGRRRPPRGARGPRGRERRAHDHQRPLGGRQRPRRPRLLRGGARAPRRPADPRRRRRRRHVLRADRRRRDHRAVELPDADRRPGGSLPRSPRATPCVREARRGDAAHRAAARRARARGGPARGRPPGPPRRRAAWSGWRLVTHDAVRKVCFTGSSAVGKRGDGRLRRAGEARHPRARRQERQHRLRRRRPRARGGARAPSSVFDNAGQDCCARSRLLVEALGLRPVHGAVRARREGVRGSWTRPIRGQRDGSAHLGRAPRLASRRYVDEARGRVPRQRPRGPRLLVPADGARAGRPRRAGRSPRRSSVRSCRSTRFARRGRGGRDRERRPLRAVGLDLDAGPVAGAARRAARRVRRRCRSTRTRSVRYHTPFGGFKQSGLGRELGPDALLGFSEEKNVFISTED